ncbi:hypothetical protein BG011_007522 [Mortierella polycephala]|uniref:FAD-binding PCMH-type domain-containing protein n=1 Tax=Mortierella polycephala TaxID=41804 RepID=A0A9P6PRY6_9FUNG|nr:hypothetical protein BG011_007522 [Mortierella polycephala]
MSVPPAPAGFLGRNIRRGVDEAYDGTIYQYAFSSYKEEGYIQPRSVIYPTDDSDVFKAIEYATDNKIGIAIRTGGHSYCGSSSTNGDNIQLDLSRTYTDFTWDNDDHTQVTLGISITLSRFQSKLRQKKRFIPTGQCSYVNLGGHVQTGGYGQLTRSFGLLADYVQKIRIITANPPEARWVDRNNAEDKPLFRAILGGSPGNFGVVTDVTLRVLKDEDHALSRGFRCLFLYTEATLKKLLDVLVEQDDNNDTPGDYDYIISLMSKREEELIDRPMSVIVVYAQWANLRGPGQAYDPTFFNKIREAGGGAAAMIPYHGILINDQQMAMSELCSHWVFNMAREYQLPYFKRLYLSNSRSHELKTNNWSAWAASRVEALEKSGTNGLHIAGQFQYCGGYQSRLITKGRDNLTSLSWRDSSFGSTLDVFYDYPGDFEARKKLRANPGSAESIRALAEVKAVALAWVEKNDLEGVTQKKFSNQDRRMMWGSHDQDLVAARTFYYDEEPTKQQLDPNFIFTANKFSIGPHPARLTAVQPKANGKQAGIDKAKSAEIEE